MYEKRPVNLLLSFIYVFKKNIVLNFKKNAKQLIVIINHDGLFSELVLITQNK